VGGLLGLVLGMGFISFVEMLWQCLRVVSRMANVEELIAWKLDEGMLSELRFVSIRVGWLCWDE